MMQLEKLRSHNITRVLKVNESTRGLYPLHKFGILLKEVYIEDTPDYNLNWETEVGPCLSFIKEGMDLNLGTLVVCTAGMSRSATICIAYLMKHKALSFKEAFDVTKNARPYVNPNPGFLKYLHGLEPQSVSKKEGCELCDLKRKTQWFDRYTECSSNMLWNVAPSHEFRVIMCD